MSKKLKDFPDVIYVSPSYDGCVAYAQDEIFDVFETGDKVGVYKLEHIAKVGKAVSLTKVPTKTLVKRKAA